MFGRKSAASISTRSDDLLGRALELAATGKYADAAAVELRLQEAEGCEDACQMLAKPAAQHAIEDACRKA